MDKESAYPLNINNWEFYIVLTKTINCGFTTEELALKMKECVDKLNQLHNDSPSISVTSVSEYIIFENEDEVRFNFK